MTRINEKRRKFLLLILICFLLLVLLVCAVIFGVRSAKRVIDQAGLSNALTLKTGDFPTVDGTYFMQAFGEATEASLTSDSIIVARENVLFTGSESAKERLLNGEADIIIVSETDAEDVISRAKEKDISVMSYTIAKDALVIFCGDEVEKTDLTEAEFDDLYESDTDGLGYSTYCYWLSSFSGKGSRLMTVNGTAPSEASIADGSYPNSYNICAVFRDNGIATNTQRVVAWMLGQEAQDILANLGYINTYGTAIPEGAGTNAYTYFATRTATSVETSGIRVIKGAEGNPVTEGTTTNYLIENPTVWTTVKAESGSFLEVSNLENETVRNAINERISKAYEELSVLDIPEYRGVRLDIPVNSILIQTNVSATLLYNFNNVVSIRMQGDYTYALPNEKGEIGENAWGYYETTKTISCCDYLTFDLNSGREISLENLFIDGCDYKTLLSLKILSDPSFGSAFILTGSYKEIRTDQKFYLENDCIYLVFDQDSPEYILPEFHESTIPVYFSDVEDNLAITARYYDEETVSTLYSNYTGQRKVLIPNRTKNDVEDSKTWTYGNVTVTQSWAYPSGLSAYGKKAVTAQYAADSTVYNRMNRADKQATYQLSTVASRLDSHLSLTTTDHRWLEGEYDVTYTKFATYNLDTLNEEKLSSLFWAGVDYEGIIRKQLAEEIAVRGGLYQTVDGEAILLTEEETEEKLRAIVSGTIPFAIDNRQLYVSFYPLQFADGNGCVILTIPYSEFGSENITIFR